MLSLCGFDSVDILEVFNIKADKVSFLDKLRHHNVDTVGQACRFPSIILLAVHWWSGLVNPHFYDIRE